MGRGRQAGVGALAPSAFPFLHPMAVSVLPAFGRIP